MAGGVSLECYIVPKIEAIEQVIEDDGIGILGSIHMYVEVTYKEQLVLYGPNADF